MIFELGIKDAFAKAAAIKPRHAIIGAGVVGGLVGAHDRYDRSTRKPTESPRRFQYRRIRNTVAGGLTGAAAGAGIAAGAVHALTKNATSPGPNLPPRDGPSDAGGAAAESGSTGTPTNIAERHQPTTKTGPGTRKGDWMGNFRNLGGASTRAKG